MGEGCCGKVYSWFFLVKSIICSTYRGIPVAIKECVIISDTQYNNVINELKTISKLRYESIIQNYGFSHHCEGDTNYFVLIMEKADCDLQDKIGKVTRDGSSKKPCSIKDKKMYILQIANGLWALNYQGLYHGDIKGDNILMVNGDCKLADFGLSKFIPDSIVYCNI